MRRRKVPTFNERKIARLEREKKEQAIRLKADYERRIDSLCERITVNEGQTLLGQRPQHAVQYVAIRPGFYGARTLVDEADLYRYGASYMKLATFEWKKMGIEIPTGDPEGEPVYVVWFVPEFRGVSIQ